MKSVMKQIREEAKLIERYTFFRKNSKRVRLLTYSGEVKLQLSYLSLFGCKDNEMTIGYIIRKKDNTIQTESHIVVPRGCTTEKWLSAIEKKKIFTIEDTW